MKIKKKKLESISNQKTEIHTPSASLIDSAKFPRSRLNVFFGSIQGRLLFCNNTMHLRVSDYYKCINDNFK